MPFSGFAPIVYKCDYCTKHFGTSQKLTHHMYNTITCFESAKEMSNTINNYANANVDEKDEEKDDVLQCKICMTNKKDISGECGYLTCHDCSDRIVREEFPMCPICREVWTGLRRCYV